MAHADQDFYEITETTDTATEVVDTAAGFKMGQSESLDASKKYIILKQLRDRHSVTAALNISAKLTQQSSTLLRNLTLMIKAHTSRQKPSLVALSLLLAKMCSKTSLQLK